MTDREQQYWFPAMSIGWGWGIANTWQGALIQLAYLPLTFVIFRYLGPQLGVGAALALFAVTTVAFLAVHWLKGEPPSWKF